jgi:hypothetical protein
MKPSQLHTSLKKLQHRRPALGTKPRRRAFELMEGRFMLSAASLAASDSTVLEAPYEIRSIIESGIAVQLQVVNLSAVAQSDGGFLELPQVAGTLANLSTGEGWGYDVTPDALFIPGSPQSTTNVPEVGNFDQTLFFNTDQTLVRIDAAVTNLLPNLLGQSNAEAAEHGTPQEGGRISIDWLQSVQGPFATHTPAETNSIVESAHGSARTVAAGEYASTGVASTITGDTARAIVFAMTGGEPECDTRIFAARRSSTEETSLEANRSEPPTSNSVASPSHVTVSRREITSSQTSARHDSARRLGSAEDLEASRWARGESHAVTASALSATPAEHRPASGAAASATDALPPTGAPTDSARTQAFEQLDSEARAAIGTTGRRYLSTTLAATPLLVVWALERLATTNSRRAAQISPTAETAPSGRRWILGAVNRDNA